MDFKIILWIFVIGLFVYVLAFATSPSSTAYKPRIHPTYLLAKYTLNNEPVDNVENT
jgi:hypothetical protein